MKFINNEKEDIEWLTSTHLKNFDVSDFQCFILYGNEDCPSKIELYKSKNPIIYDKPYLTFIADEEGNLMLDLPTE